MSQTKQTTDAARDAGQFVLTAKQRKLLAQLAGKINAVIHSRNLYFIATGARCVNAVPDYSRACVFVHELYGNVGHQFMAGAFHDGNGGALEIDAEHEVEALRSIAEQI